MPLLLRHAERLDGVTVRLVLLLPLFLERALDTGIEPNSGFITKHADALIQLLVSCLAGGLLDVVDKADHA